MSTCIPCQELLTAKTEVQPHAQLMELKTIKIGDPEYVRNATWKRFMCKQCSSILKWQPGGDEEPRAGWIMSSN